jgi:HEAT repeat protein
MPEPVINEIRKLSAIATDMDLASSLRANAIKSMGSIGTRDALLALLDLIANESLTLNERKLAIKQAERNIK